MTSQSDEQNVLSPQRLLVILERQIQRDPQISSDDLIRIAVLQVCRPGQIGYHLNPYLRSQLVERIKREVSGAPKEILTRLSSQIFIWVKEVLPKSISAQARQRPLQTQKQLRKILQKKADRTSWTDEDVNRVATEIYKTQKKSRQGIRALHLDAQDPLRKVWGFEGETKIDLPRQDVRHKLLDSFKGVKNRFGHSLADTLREASVFRPEVLRAALGDLWRIGQPVGFVDQKKTILLFRVSNSADAQELMFQQNEIIERLKSLPGFSDIKKVRFEIKS